MANNRLRGNFLSGITSDNPLSVGATALNSAGLATIPAVANGDYMPITLDPGGVAGSPEIVYVTSHVALATDGTILRAQEGTLARQHALGTTWHNSPTTLDFRGINGDRAWSKGAAAHALDDEFNDGVLDPTWVRWDLTSSGSAPVTWSEGADSLAVVHSGHADHAGPSHCLLKPLGGLTFPITIESAFRCWRRYATNYQMFGILFTDGLLQTSKALWINPYASTNTATAFSVRTCGWNAMNGGETYAPGPNVNYEMVGGPMYQKLRWSAANTFQSFYGIDGVGWHKLPTGDMSFTMTPTYVGIAISNWTIANANLLSADYFRVTAA